MELLLCFWYKQHKTLSQNLQLHILMAVGITENVCIFTITHDTPGNVHQQNDMTRAIQFC